MESSWKKRASDFMKAQKKKKSWHKVVTAMAAVVVFATTYMLILPAITMTDKTICGYEAHAHAEECYKTVTTPAVLKMACGEESLKVHQHTDECYNEKNEIICGYADYVIHEHGEYCYDEADKLICTLKEIKSHVHTDSCYGSEDNLICEKQGAEVHEHTDSCYTDGKLTCGKLETKEHQHTKDCVEVVTEEKTEKVLVCELEEHEHTDACYPEEKDGISLFSTEAQPANFSEYVTGVNYSGVQYNPETEKYVVDLSINFEIGREQVKSDNYEYYYDLPADIEVPDNLLGTTYNGYDDGKLGFTYEYVKNSDGTYRILIHFDETYINESGETVDGFIGFNGNMGKGAQKEDGSLEVKFDDLTVTIPPEDITYPDNATANYDMDMSKSGSYVQKDGKLLYTVTITTKNGTPDPISIEDALELNGIDVSSVQVESVKKTQMVDNGWGLTDGDTTEVTDYTFNAGTTNKDFTMSLPALEDNQKYTITYSYDLDSVPEGTSVNSSNKINAQAEDKNTGELIKDSANTSVKVSKNSLTKSGWYDGENVNWTLKVNSSGGDIAGQVLTDSMFDQITDESQLSISPNSGYTLVKNEEGKITGIEFTGDTNTNAYTVNYKVPVDKQWDSQTVSNTANLGPGDGSEPGVSTGPVNVNVESGKKVEKTLVAQGDVNTDGTVIYQWNTNITIPAGGMPEGVVFEDEIIGSNSQNNHYMTSVQAENLIRVLDNSFAGKYTIEFTKMDGTVTSSITEGDTYKKYRVTFPDGLSEEYGNQTYAIAYATTIDTNGITDEAVFQNKAVLDGTESSVWPRYKTKVVKYDKNGKTGTTNVSSEDGTVSWKVKVLWDKNYDSFTIEDQLPEGLELVSLSYGSNSDTFAAVISEDGSISASTSGDGAKVSLEGSSFDASTGALLVKVQPADGSNRPYWINKDQGFYLTYTCKITDVENIPEGESKTYELSNNVKVSTNEGAYGSATQQQNTTVTNKKVEKTVIDKNGQWSKNDRRINYSIDINPDAKDLLEGVDKIHLTDKVTYSDDDNWGGHHEREVSLLQSSVKLYYAQTDDSGNPILDSNGKLVKGSEVRDWSWSFNTEHNQWNTEVYNTIDAEIPDGKALIFEYSYEVYLNAPADWNINVNNTVSLYGDKKYEDSSQNNDKWGVQDTTAGIKTNKRYTLYKVEENQFSTALDGAEFTLFKYNKESGQFESTGKVYQTKNGQLVIYYQEADSDYQFDYNTAYYIQETKAPAGYQMPENPEKYYFYFSNEETQTESYPDNWADLTTVDLSVRSHTEYCENIKNATSITVDKKWFKKDGTETTKAKGSITFDLMQKAVPAEGSAAQETVTKYDTYTIEGPNWTWTNDTLPRHGMDANGNKVVYKYYVVEEENADYTAAYENNDGIETGTILIKNQVNDAFVLPETGGPGTALYTAGGVLLMMIALFMYRKKRLY